MHEFIVTITCLIIANCPLPDKKPLVQAFHAKSEYECRSAVENLAAAYGYDTKKFHVKCEQK